MLCYHVEAALWGRRRCATASLLTLQVLWNWVHRVRNCTSPTILKILKIRQNLTELGTIINKRFAHSIFGSFHHPCSGTREEGAHQCLHFLQSRLQPAVFKRPPPICDAKPTTPTHHCRPSRSFWPRRRLQHTCAAIFWGKKYMPYLFPPCFLKESNIYAPAPYSPGAHEQRRQPWAKRRAAAKKNLFILLS